MSRVREIMLQRSKEPAKVHPIERPRLPRPDSPTPSLDGTAGSGCQNRPPSPTPAEPPSPRGAAGRALGGPQQRGGGAVAAGAPGTETAARRPAATREEPQPQRQGKTTRCGPAGATGAQAAEKKEPMSRSVSLPAIRKDEAKVPAYLRRRQAEAAEERRRATLPIEPAAPPGYRFVSEEERLASLEVLIGRRAEAEAAIARLPFVIETPGQRRREREAQERLEHLEKLVKMYSSKEVFVPLDAEPIGRLAAKAPVRLPEAESPAALAARGRVDMDREGLPEMQLVRNQTSKATLGPGGGRNRLALL